MQGKELQPGKGSCQHMGANCPCQGQHFVIGAAFPPQISALYSSDIASQDVGLWGVSCTTASPASPLHSLEPNLCPAKGTSPLLAPKSPKLSLDIFCAVFPVFSPYGSLCCCGSQSKRWNCTRDLHSSSAGKQTFPCSHLTLGEPNTASKAEVPFPPSFPCSIFLSHCHCSITMLRWWEFKCSLILAACQIFLNEFKHGKEQWLHDSSQE